MNTKVQQSKEVLEAKGLKPTYPRLKVLEYLQKREDHPTVDMIYEDLVKKIPTISKTTIYNTLKAFLEKGIVHSITITGTETRYDLESCLHHHLLCKRCGRILDLAIECPYVEDEEIAGHRIEERHGYFKGICKECLKKDKR